MNTGANWAENVIQQDSYSPTELAELLDMDEGFIKQEVQNGRLRGTKLGSDIVEIKREAVIEWMNRRERGEDRPIGT
jgi:excisionase family DNA binding protein